MGIRARFVLVAALIAFSVGLASYLMLEKSNSELLEMSAVRVADIVSAQVVADRAVECFTDNVDAVVGCNQSLVISADSQQQACDLALSSLVRDVDDGRDVAASLRSLAETANENAKSAVDSAVHCNELDESFTSLKGRLQGMLRG
jgi:hypothetical protein